jgi:hypothetical protein
VLLVLGGSVPHAAADAPLDGDSAEDEEDRVVKKKAEAAGTNDDDDTSDDATAAIATTTPLWRRKVRGIMFDERIKDACFPLQFVRSDWCLVACLPKKGEEGRRRREKNCRCCLPSTGRVPRAEPPHCFEDAEQKAFLRWGKRALPIQKVNPKHAEKVMGLKFGVDRELNVSDAASTPNSNH